MAYGIRPAEGGAGKGLSIRCAPRLGGQLGGSDIGHRRDKIEAGNELTLVWKSDCRRSPEGRARIEIQADPLRSKSAGTNEGLHEEINVGSPLLTDESGILDATVHHS